MGGGRMAREGNESRREGECCKRLSLHKHRVSLSSHMWNCFSGQCDALMEINHCDITLTFVAAQHSPPSLLSSSLCLRPLKGNLPLWIKTWLLFSLFLPLSLSPSLTASLTPYLVDSPLIINATPLIRSISTQLSHPLHLHAKGESKTANNLG